MAIPINSEFKNQDWNKLLQKGDLKGRQVEKMAKAVKGKNDKDVQYDPINNIITCGSQSLDLNKLDKPKSSLRLYHRFRMYHSDKYKSKKLKDIEYLSKLIENKITEDKSSRDYTNDKDASRWTPLTTAIFNNDISKVNELIRQKADLNELNANGNTPLTQAALSGNSLIIEKLIANGADVELKNSFGNTALTIATQMVNHPLINLLVQKGAKFQADRINALNLNGSTPLTSAILHGDLARVDLLIQQGADVNIADKYKTPLAVAVVTGNFSLTEKLINSGADVSEINSHGQSVIDLLKSTRPKNYRPILELIYEKNPELKARHKEFKYRKQLGHAWHLKGESSLKADDIPLKLEGANTLLWYHQMHKNFEEFQKLSTDFSEPKVFSEAVKFTADINAYTPDQILTRIQSGLPTFLDAGFIGHDIAFKTN